MNSFDIAGLSALEILDSRGRPTLAVTVQLGGQGVLRAVASVNIELAGRLCGRGWFGLADVGRAMTGLTTTRPWRVSAESLADGRHHLGYPGPVTGQRDTLAARTKDRGSPPRRGSRTAPDRRQPVHGPAPGGGTG